MVRGGFCQRSQFRGMQPAVSVRSGDVDVVRRDDQQGPPRGIRQRVDFFAFAATQCRAAKKKKGNVRAEPGGDIEKARRFKLLTRELQVPKQRRCRIAGTASQSATSWNLFLQQDFDAWAQGRFTAQSVHRAVNQILLALFLREGFVALNLQRDARTSRGPEPQSVMQRHGLKYGAEFVVAVGALSQHFQTQVDLGVRRNSDCSHLRTQGLASAGGVFCATRCLFWLSFFSTSATLSSSRSAGKERCHSLIDFSHSATARSIRPCLASTSPKCSRMVGSWDSRSTALRSVSSACSSLFCL